MIERRKKMKEKIIGIIVCMLLIATAIPAVGTLNNNEIAKTVTVGGAVDAPVWKKGDSWTFNYHRIINYYNGSTLWRKQNYNCTMTLTVIDDTGDNYTAKLTSKNNEGSETIGSFQLKYTKSTKLNCDSIYRKTDLGGLYETDQMKGPVIWLIGGKLPFPAQYQYRSTWTYTPAWAWLPFPFSAGISGTVPAYQGTLEEKCALYWGLITLFNHPSAPFTQGTLPYQCAMANVTVPAGNYNAYNVSVDFPVGMHGHYSWWQYYVPDVGYNVKMYVYYTLGGGQLAQDIRYELVSTTHTP
jgi:hypothetical protein